MPIPQAEMQMWNLFHSLIEYNHFITTFIWWNPVKLLVHMISDSVYKGIIAMEITLLEGSTEKARSRESFSGINDWILNTKTEYNEYWILYKWIQRLND